MSLKKFNNLYSFLTIASLLVVFTTGLLFSVMRASSDDSGKTISSTILKRKVSILVNAQENNIDNTSVVFENKTEYDLPYPGILPDNPLYSVKKFRDSIWLFLTRDQIQKSELLLKISDKKVAMAQELVVKDKWSLIIDELESSEKMIDKMIEYLDLSEKIGVAATDDFIRKSQDSNARHYEVINNILSVAPEENKEALRDIIIFNREHRDALEKL